MTLDVTICKLIPINQPQNNVMNPSYDVIQCPNVHENICDPKHTYWPNESYRSGNSIGLRRFFLVHTEYTYSAMTDSPQHQDICIAYIKPRIREINELHVDIKLCRSVNEYAEDLDRMKWFKYWCNKAVELYDNEAAIMFS